MFCFQKLLKQNNNKYSELPIHPSTIVRPLIDLLNILACIYFPFLYFWAH